MSTQPAAVFKIVVTGPFSTGKTTFVETFAERELVATEASTTSDSETQVKRATTVGMDFGVLTLADPGGDIELRLYGTPGQERFNFMWEMLADGAHAFVLLVNGQDESTWSESRQHYEVMQRFDIPGIIAVNRAAADSLSRVREHFSDLTLPVVPCEATEFEDVKAVLVEALLAVLAELEEAEIADPTGAVS